MEKNFRSQLQILIFVVLKIRYTSFFDLKFGMIKLGVFDWNPEFPIYLYIAGFRRQFSSPSRSKTSLWRPKISPSQTFPVDEL